MSKIITIFGVAILSSILYFTLQDYMIIITSAIFGSYIFIRGISLYAGGYVDEFTVILTSGNGDLGEVKWTVILYWALMGLLALASIHSQL